jgi:hypothetical protein
MQTGLFLEVAVGRRERVFRLRLLSGGLRQVTHRVWLWLRSDQFDPDYVRRHTGAR